jgi:DNA-binding PadR family transcriptional regulator
MSIDSSWFAVFRQMFLQGTVAEIGGTAFTVYCAIKAHADFNEGISFPSQKLIANQTGFSERQVIKSLKVLEEHGLLEKTKENKHNVYRLKEKIVFETAEERIMATWDYLPATLRKARQELHHFVVTGEFKDAKIINITIERLHIDTFIAGDQVLRIELEGIKDESLRRKMEQLLTRKNFR